MDKLLSGLLSALEQYGIITVLVAIILFLGVIAAKKYLEKFFLTKDKMMEVIVSAENEKKKIELDHLREQYDLDIQKNQKINDKLLELLLISGSGRTSLWIIHNGSRTLNNTSLLKFSCTHFKLNSNSTIPSPEVWRDTPLSVSNTFLKILTRDRIYKEFDIECVNEYDCSLANIFKQQNIKSILSFPIYDENSKIQGWISCEWDKLTEKNDEEIKNIKDITRSINLHLV